MSFTRAGETEPRIVVLPNERLQEAFARSCREFGDPSAPAFPSDAMLKRRG